MKGTKYMVTEDDLTLDGGHTIQYTNHASQKCTLETYVILSTNKFFKIAAKIQLSPVPFSLTEQHSGESACKGYRDHYTIKRVLQK